LSGRLHSAAYLADQIGGRLSIRHGQAEQDYLRRFEVTHDGKLSRNPTLGGVRGPVCDLKAAEVAKAAKQNDMCPMPGGMISISSHGREGAILWATLPVSLNVPYFTSAGVPPSGQLLAYDAITMRLLWRQDLPHDASDRTSLLGKWTPPTIADGKVFVGTSPSAPAQDGRLLVYELAPRE
jgi:outer membrane protein assembly factor BamB